MTTLLSTAGPPRSSASARRTQTGAKHQRSLAQAAAIFRRGAAAGQHLQRLEGRAQGAAAQRNPFRHRFGQRRADLIRPERRLAEQPQIDDDDLADHVGVDDERAHAIAALLAEQRRIGRGPVERVRPMRHGRSVSPQHAAEGASDAQREVGNVFEIVRPTRDDPDFLMRP